MTRTLEEEIGKLLESRDKGRQRSLAYYHKTKKLKGTKRGWPEGRKRKQEDTA